MGVPVWLFVPNLIGYTRIITGLAAFVYAFDENSHGTFFALYAFSYGLDALDGVAARKLNQCSSFGALLDMVTDRFCTAALLAVLAHLYPKYHVAFLYLMILDIVSHWTQMYSSMASGASSHKNLKDELPLLRFYYTFPYALFTVCLMNEACLVAMFLVKHEDAVTAAIKNNFPLAASAIAYFGNAVFAAPVPASRMLLYVTFPVFALKQVFSILQLGTAALRILALDERKRAAVAAAAAAKAA